VQPLFVQVFAAFVDAGTHCRHLARHPARGDRRLDLGDEEARLDLVGLGEGREVTVANSAAARSVAARRPRSCRLQSTVRGVSILEYTNSSGSPAAFMTNSAPS
jgi:hypothetical protein